MKLLIITQKIDKNDDVLGFFHHWIIEFAKHVQFLTVICLYEGDHDLPNNVKVLSLGKEERKFSIFNFHFFKMGKYVINFYKHLWRERRNYDSVFVHMNQEYALLGGPIWKLFGKKLAMWRNHPSGSILTRFAVLLSDVVMCTSGSSFTARFKKTILMPAGVDTEYFKRNESLEKRYDSILFLSRVDPIKRPEVLIDSFSNVKKEGKIKQLDFYGGVKEEYKMSLRTLSKDSGNVLFHGSRPHFEVKNIYNRFAFSANLTFSGSLDKTMLEHMSTEGIVFCSNDYLLHQLPENLRNLVGFNDGDSKDLASKISILTSKAQPELEALGKKSREFVIKNHSLSLLVPKLMSILK